MGRIIMNNRIGTVVDFNPKYGAIVDCKDFNEPVLVSIQALWERYPFGVKPGQVIRFTSRIEASDVEVLEDELPPLERGKIIRAERTFVVIKVAADVQQRLMLDSPTIIANQKEGGWSYQLTSLVEQGINLIDLEVEFHLGSFFDERQGDRKVAKHVQLFADDDLLRELVYQFSELVYRDQLKIEPLYTRYCAGEVVVRVVYGRSPFDWTEVTLRGNSDIRQELKDTLFYRDNALHLL